MNNNHEHIACAIEIDPTEVDAGGEFTLTGTITGAALDLRGRSLVIRDQQGTPLGEMEIVEFDGEANRTSALVLRAPLETGDHSWQAVLPEYEAEGVVYEEVSAPVSFIVKPHGLSVVVWDVPSAIVTGERFALKIGVKCSAACPPAGWTIEVQDHEGALLATAAPGDEPWAGTDALYFTEVELAAPLREGFHRWTAKAIGADGAIPHAERAATFGVRTVPPAEFLIRVEAIDQETQTPVARAKVVVHPYRTFTDAQGVAEVRVPRGAYRIFVSGKKYIPFRHAVEVDGNLTMTAELQEDVGLSEADIWA